MDARTAGFSVADAKARFSEPLVRAEAGEEVVIRRHGAPVARLVSIHKNGEQDGIARREQAWREWKAYRAERKLKLGSPLTIRQLIDWGRKY